MLLFVLRTLIFVIILCDVSTELELTLPFTFELIKLLVKVDNGFILVNPKSLFLINPLFKSFGVFAKKFCLFLNEIYFVEEFLLNKVL